MAASASKLGGGVQGDKNNFWGGNAEIIKLGLILTHLKSFWGQIGGGKKIFWGANAPCGTATGIDCVLYGHIQNNIANF